MCAMARHPGDTVSVLMYRTGIQDANLAGNVYGGWITGPSFNAPNAFLRAGLDYLGIDCQHSFLHEADAARIVNDLQHADIAVVVRVFFSVAKSGRDR